MIWEAEGHNECTCECHVARCDRDGTLLERRLPNNGCPTTQRRRRRLMLRAEQVLHRAIPGMPPCVHHMTVGRWW